MSALKIDHWVSENHFTEGKIFGQDIIVEDCYKSNIVNPNIQVLQYLSFTNT